MNQQEREKLMDLLTRLIAAQNDVAQVKGSQGWLDALVPIGKRNEVKDEILSFVESLTEK